VDRGIYFAANRARREPLIEFFEFATHRVRQVARPTIGPDMYTPGLAVSPDERFLLYAQKDQTGSTIMMVDRFQ
jgi:hypothetical protein